MLFFKRVPGVVGVHADFPIDITVPTDVPKETDMKLRTLFAVIVLVATTTVWAQSAQPSNSAVGTPVPLRGTRSFGSARTMPSMAAAGANGVPNVTPHQRLQDLEGTLSSMHILLKQMRAKAVSSPKDPLIKANP